MNNEVTSGILNNAFKTAMRLTTAESGSLFIFDLASKELVLDSSSNGKNAPAKGLRRRMGEGISGKVVSMKEPVLVKNIDRDSRFQKNGFIHYRTNSFISIPLFNSQGLLLGLINLADKASGEPFSEEDLDKAVALADFACKISEYVAEKTRIDEKYSSIGRLTAGMAHEINNPLDGIMRYANILLGHADNDTVTNEYLLEIKKGLGAIARATKSLMNYSRQIGLHETGVNNYVRLEEIIEEALALFSWRIDGGIKVVKNYKQGIARVLNFGLINVFSNLIKNALDAMPAGGSLEISTGLSDGFIEIRFMDSGIGIPPELQSRVFEPFFTTKRGSQQKGNGLGLAICREIIERYNGRIDIQSSAPSGTTFRVLIPQNFLQNA